MKRAERKSKAPQRRKPPHQAPIQRGSSGVMSSLAAVNHRGFRGWQRSLLLGLLLWSCDSYSLVSIKAASTYTLVQTEPKMKPQAGPNTNVENKIPARQKKE